MFDKNSCYIERTSRLNGLHGFLLLYWHLKHSSISLRTRILLLMLKLNRSILVKFQSFAFCCVSILHIQRVLTYFCGVEKIHGLGFDSSPVMELVVWFDHTINWRDVQRKNVVNNVEWSGLRAPWRNGPSKSKHIEQH